MMAEIYNKNMQMSLKQQLPFFYRASVAVLEVSFVIILAVICANSITSFVDYDDEIRVRTKAGKISNNNHSAINNQFTSLKTVDAFFGAIISNEFVQPRVAPTSTLDVKIFGLRAKGKGKGTVILKAQGKLQSLTQIGDEITTGVHLMSVFADHIEIRRNGRVESIYLEKTLSQLSSQIKPPTRASQPSLTDRKNVQKTISNFIKNIDLSPFRNGNKIDGFTIGSNAPVALLSLAGLEIGDIISSVNGNRLHSWERVKEIPEEYNARSDDLHIDIMRRGALLTLSLSLTSLGI